MVVGRPEIEAQASQGGLCVHLPRRGRLAELYWPDDGYWYLIEIQDVNSAAMTAHIMYMTGDTEELQLGDIIRDKHMHLIVR